MSRTSYTAKHGRTVFVHKRTIILSGYLTGYDVGFRLIKGSTKSGALIVYRVMDECRYFDSDWK